MTRLDQDKLPNGSTVTEAFEWLEKYPYFILPAIQALKQGAVTTDGRGEELAARVAVSLTDKETLSRTLGQQARIFDNFYPDDTKSTPGTIDTIDTFLATFGTPDERETDALSKMIFSPVPDYAAVLAAEEKKSVPGERDLQNPELSEQDRRINNFIALTHGQTADTQKSDKLTNEEPQAAVPRKETENPSLTESLVRVLVKNRNYTKAIEIISELSLKNPEKSIYFADQIRFLRKLIINENKK